MDTTSHAQATRPANTDAGQMVAPRGHILTYSGQYIDPLRPEKDKIFIADIARGLSNVCRFAGQTGLFYSVAEHSVRVMLLVESQLEALTAAGDNDLTPTQQRHLLLYALLHDAAEAYLGDVPTPIKARRTDYVHDEARLQKVIFDAFGIRLNAGFIEIVGYADRVLLVTEARDLKGIDANRCWGFAEPPLEGLILPQMPMPARESFLKHFRRIAMMGHGHG